MANGNDDGKNMAGKWIQVGKEANGTFHASVTDDSGNHWGYAIGSSRELAVARITELRSDIGWATPSEVRDA
jgi:hypothetical protein